MEKPLRKRPIKYVAKPGEPTLEQKLKAYQKIANQIARRKSQTDEEAS